MQDILYKRHGMLYRLLKHENTHFLFFYMLDRILSTRSGAREIRMYEYVYIDSRSKI